jgi:hypothetical protein
VDASPPPQESVHRHHPVPILFADLHHRGPTDDARIVDQNVNASELSHRSLHHALAIRGVRNIYRFEESTTANSGNLFHHESAGIVIHIRNRNRRALPRKQ